MALSQYEQFLDEHKVVENTKESRQIVSIGERIARAAQKYYEFKERCIFCDIIRQELSDKLRIINDYGDFVAFAPFASRFPFGTNIPT